MTNAERLTRIETLLTVHAEKTEAILATNAETAKAVHDQLVALDQKWEARFNAMDAELRADVANLAAFENKGKGAFAVLTIVFTSLGAFVMASWDKITSLFH